MPVIHPVVQILYRRRDEGSLPGARTDGYRVGLAVEGGGMRGIISGAMMATLMNLAHDWLEKRVKAILEPSSSHVKWRASIGSRSARHDFVPHKMAQMRMTR